MTDIRVDGERLWQSLMTMAEIGATPAGGVNRQTLTDEDKRGRDLFRRWCEEAGLQVSVDRMGSMFARREGTDAGQPPVMLGSHLDSQPTGGKFDGALGVLAALEVVRTLNDHDIATRAPLEVVNWTNEEGCRFPPAMIASGVFAGVFDLEHGLSRKDHAGRTIGDELRRIGYAGERPVGQRPIGALFELHIEQGPILEAEGQRIGIVTGAQGARWYDCAVTGAETHAGAAPMEGRRDALRAAAALLEDIYAIAHRHAPAGRATVGEFQAYPARATRCRAGSGSRSICAIPTAAPWMRWTARCARRSSGRAAAPPGGSSSIWMRSGTRRPWHSIRSASRRCVRPRRRLGLSAREIVSGAGHDAVYMARVVPTAMIFVPCKDGISHAEIEYASPEACADGANVLLHAVLARAHA